MVSKRCADQRSRGRRPTETAPEQDLVNHCDLTRPRASANSKCRGCVCGSWGYDGVVVRSRSLLSAGRGRFGLAQSSATAKTAHVPSRARKPLRHHRAGASARNYTCTPRDSHFLSRAQSCGPIHSLAHDQRLRDLDCCSAALCSTSFWRSTPAPCTHLLSPWQKSAASARWTATALPHPERN